MAKARLPVVPAMPPIEKSTSAGTPLATQKAPRQSMVLWSWPPAGAAPAVVMEVMRSPLSEALFQRRLLALRQGRDLSRSRPRRWLFSAQLGFFLVSEEWGTSLFRVKRPQVSSTDLFGRSRSG